jgi:uncharacterized protein YjiK
MKKISLNLNRKLFIFLIALSDSLFIAGCGGGSSTSITTTPTATPPPSEAPITPTPPPVTPPTVPQQPPANQLYDLGFIESFNLDIAEPSGLSWALNGKDFLVVDDHGNEVYKIDKQGNMLSDYFYSGDDLEGISVDVQSQTIWLAEEAKSKVVELDSVGNKIQSFKLNIDRDSSRRSLEGISYDADNNTFYILNEDKPGLLITWQPENGITDQIPLHFAKDYSGIFYDKTDNSLWIISDQSQKLFHCDTDGNVKQGFNLAITKPEGIVVDSQNKRVYIVSDLDHRLYVFSLAVQQ